MGVLLALVAALAYGLSDFVGGIAARRTTAWPVALLAGVGGLAGALALWLALPGDPTRADVLWGALSGVGSGAGSAFLYRGFATGRMGVVAPVSAVGAAVLPVAVGVATGERPGPTVWVGILAALPGIWLVARMPDGPPTGPPTDPPAGPDAGPVDGLVDGLLAGAGFGLLFVALGQVPDGAGYLPLVAGQVTSLVAVVTLASVFGAAWLPRAATEWWGVGAGLLASAAVLCFLLATQQGLLTVAAVLTSLYPAFTVLMAATVLRERIYGAQAVGLALCGVAVGLVAAG